MMGGEEYQQGVRDATAAIYAILEDEGPSSAKDFMVDLLSRIDADKEWRFFQRFGFERPYSHHTNAEDVTKDRGDSYEP